MGEKSWRPIMSVITVMAMSGLEPFAPFCTLEYAGGGSAAISGLLSCCVGSSSHGLPKVYLGGSAVTGK